jgi:uroporphyrin-III C-methyltransferase
MAENVSHPDQRLTRHRLAGLARDLAQVPGDAPALILYGPLMDKVADEAAPAGDAD